MSDKSKAEQFDAICDAIDHMPDATSLEIHKSDLGYCARVEWYAGGNRTVTEIVQSTAKLLLLDVARRLP